MKGKKDRAKGQGKRTGQKNRAKRTGKRAGRKIGQGRRKKRTGRGCRWGEWISDAFQDHDVYAVDVFFAVEAEAVVGVEGGGRGFAGVSQLWAEMGEAGGDGFAVGVGLCAGFCKYVVSE